MRIYYRLTAIDPIIVSQQSGTSSNHDCLDYIPGSAILGAIASKLYPQLDETQSWNLFHSGEVQFAPCYPLIEGQLSLPTPASWHVEKGQSHKTSEGITNHCCSKFERDETTQYQQCRSGFIDHSGFRTNVLQGMATKTALDAQTRTVVEGQLFNYSFIEAGQEFGGWIEVESSSLQALLQPLLKGILRIGRSRNTEFGRVSIQLQQVNDSQKEQVTLTNKLVLWLLSDAQLLDGNGLATYTPDGAAIHPQIKARLNAQHSFILTTSVSRFNQKRGGLDSEQPMIRKGSVLVYDLDEPLTPEVLEQLQRGIGINRQQGLGWVSVNPPWAELPGYSAEQPLFSPLLFSSAITPTPVTSADTHLFHWLEAKLKGASKQNESQQQVNESIAQIISAYQHARRYNNIALSHEAGPSGSQWRRIADVVRQTNDEHWQGSVFNGENAICKATNDTLGWGIQWHQEKQITFADFCQRLLCPLSVTTMRLLLEQLCRFDLSQMRELEQAKKEFHLNQEDA